MSDNKSFQLSILISMLLHFTVFLSAPYTVALPKKQALGPIKVAYIKPKKLPKKIVGQKPLNSPGKAQVFAPLAPETLPEVKKEEIADNKPLPLSNPKPSVENKTQKQDPTVETIGAGGRTVIEGKGRKFETVVNNEKDSWKKATYIGYYRSVREKIRYYADRNYVNAGSMSKGEVFLSFVVASS